MYDGWAGDQGGIHCWQCFLGDVTDCKACDNQRAIVISGTPEEAIEGDAHDVYRTVRLISQTAQHEFPRSATEYLEQPAKWIAAYEFLMPFLKVEIEMKRKREDAHNKT